MIERTLALSQNEFAYVFEGDGRKKVAPKPEWEMPGVCMPVLRGSARFLGQMFEERGRSVHSEHGYTVWVTLAWAQYKGIGVVYKYVAGEGYEISKTL